MDAEHNQLLATLAQDYYLSKMAISDISKKYHLSRYLIMKYLDEALASGIVSINIHTDYDRNAKLERTLQQHFKIKNLIVIKDPTNPQDRDQIIATFAANQVQSLIRDCHTVGLTWGETIYAMLDHFNKQTASQLTFTQFMGENMRYHSSAASMRMVQKAAAKYDVPYQTIPGPLYIINDQARTALYQEPAFTAALRRPVGWILSFVGLAPASPSTVFPPGRRTLTGFFPESTWARLPVSLLGGPMTFTAGSWCRRKMTKPFPSPSTKSCGCPDDLPSSSENQSSKRPAVLWRGSSLPT